MLDPTMGWAIAGAEDHVLRTDDGGETWHDVTPPESAPIAEEPGKIASGFFLDANRAWITFSHPDLSVPAVPTVWRTGDGGQSWEPSLSLHLASLLAEFYDPAFMQFIDPENGWLLVNIGAGMSHVFMALFKTADGGITWDRLIDPATDDLQLCTKTGMDFVDAEFGWVTRDCQGVVEGVQIDWTSDGGLTWQAQSLPSPTSAKDLFDSPTLCGAHSPTLISRESGAVVVRCIVGFAPDLRTASFLYTTLDGGETWTSNPFPGDSLAFIDADLGWGLGRDVYMTEDGGQTWVHVKAVSWDGQFSFIDDQLGWAVARLGDETALVKTVDGGLTWAQLTPQVVP